MAISIAWGTKVITVPQADLTFISGSLYEMNVNTFRLDLKSLEDDETGMVFARTHNHNTEVTLGGVTLARTVEIINGYTITFTPNSQWAVRLAAANNNIADVLNVNQVQLRSNNSAGLITVTPSLTEEDKPVIADAVWNAATATYGGAGSYGLLVETDLDAAISSRSTYAGGAVASVTNPVTVGTNNDKTGYSIGVGGIAATAFAAGAVDAAAIGPDAITSSELAASAAQEVADEVLNRNLAGGASGNTRNVRNALRVLRNKVSESGGTLTVNEEDDTTPAWTATTTRTPGLDPLSGVDPA